MKNVKKLKELLGDLKKWIKEQDIDTSEAGPIPVYVIIEDDEENTPKKKSAYLDNPDY